jgi:exonuclease III
MATRSCKVLSWNVRGINSDKKWDAVRDRVLESSCDIVCLQETKKESFDHIFIKKIYPNIFDAFEYIPAQGASSGSVIIWKSSLLSGTKIFQNDFCRSLELCSKFNDDT